MDLSVELGQVSWRIVPGRLGGVLRWGVEALQITRSNMEPRDN